jgi:exopolysaccharide production protein ExoZ
MIRQYVGTNHVTGLRGYAALLVVLVHTGGFSDFGRLLSNLTKSGRHGVVIFFVVSGFSVAASFLSSRTYSEYLTRRFVRIWPLYAAALGFSAILATADLIPRSYWMERFGVDFSAYNILMHLSFLSFLDYRIANSIIGVEWSIPIEVVWYLLIPVCLRSFYDTRKLAIAAVIFLIAGYVLNFALVSAIGKDGGLAAHWLPVRYGYFFMVGILAFKLRSEAQSLTSSTRAAWFLGSVVATAIFLVIDFKRTEECLALTTMAMIIAYDDDAPLAGVLTNKVMLYIGTISYSIYLLHYPVLLLVKRHMVFPAVFNVKLMDFLITTLATLALASITYVLIERPTNNLGRYLVLRRRPA